MRASKLIAVSTVAILVAGTNLAIGQGSLQSSRSMKESSTSKGTLRGFEPGQPGRIRAHKGGPAYARATSREMEAGLSTQERSHLRDMVREMPRISNVGTDIRIDALVPKNVRQAAAPVPPEIQRMSPRFRQGRAFVHHDHIVIVDPITSRIVAIAKI
jgi:hypothetical protein